MKFHLYAEKIFSKRGKKFTGTAVMITSCRIPELEERSVRCYTFNGKPEQFDRWRKMLSHLQDGQGWAVTDMPEEILVNKIAGRKISAVRDPNWESKIGDYKV